MEVLEKCIANFYFFPIAGSESPSPFPLESRKSQLEGERIRQMAKRLIGPEVAEKQLSNEISAPYEVPQYPIEQIETKLIRLVWLTQRCTKILPIWLGFN